jgi:3-phenylpropionate/trans-cinnamate dioxygenase ferredoxin reductase subunit
LAEGTVLRYDKLLLTTGSAPRRLTVPGADDPRVYYLRSVDDSDALKQLLQSAGRIAVIGAGWIGLEVTAAARLAGVEVTVLETLELPLVRVLGREVAEVFADLHRQHDVDLRFGAQVQEITAQSRAGLDLRLADGEHVAADAAIVGIGISPNTQLAEAAGLDVDNGVVVDEHLRSSDPDIYAAGDVANAFHPLLGKRIRVEHWANALNQPKVAAQSMVGQDAVYERIPYFFTDQYDLGMEYAGYAGPGDYDSVVFRGDKERREFIAFWLANGRVVAGMNVNIWDVIEQIQDLIRSGRQVDVARLADPEVPLSDL